MAFLTEEQMRDYIIRAHSMATGRFIQTDTVMRGRIGRLLGEAIGDDDKMQGLLGYGPLAKDLDVLKKALEGD